MIEKAQGQAGGGRVNGLAHIAAWLDEMPGDDGLVQCACGAWVERHDPHHKCIVDDGE